MATANTTRKIIGEMGKPFDTTSIIGSAQESTPQHHLHTTILMMSGPTGDNPVARVYSGVVLGIIPGWERIIPGWCSTLFRVRVANTNRSNDTKNGLLPAEASVQKKLLHAETLSKRVRVGTSGGRDSPLRRDGDSRKPDPVGWAKIWHAKLARFHHVPKKKRWIYGTGEVVAFLIDQKKAGPSPVL